jgi:hypothetical protein
MSNPRKRTWSKLMTAGGLVMVGMATASAPLDAQATTQTSNHRLRFSNQAVIVPNQGPFTVNGGVHVLLHSTLDASGGCHVTGHANPQGLSVSGPGGATYRAAGAANFTLQATSGESGTRFHGVLNLNLIGKGQSPDAKLHFNVKTEPATAPTTCDARKIARLVVDELGVTLPPAPAP